MKRKIPRGNKELDEKSRVCELHFDEDMIIKFSEHTINGKEVCQKFLLLVYVFANMAGRLREVNTV